MNNIVFFVCAENTIKYYRVFRLSQLFWVLFSFLFLFNLWFFSNEHSFRLGADVDEIYVPMK